MRTKQIRISGTHHVREKAKSFVGKNINIVLSKNVTIFGKLLASHDDHLVVENTRLKKQSIALQEINEFYFDATV
jgi:hypothetical protein